MAERKTLLTVTITDVSDKPLTYPACPNCYAKIEQQAADNMSYCTKCKRLMSECSVIYRYCLVVTVDDASMSANVAVFGSSLNKLLGSTPKQMHM